MVSFLLEKWKFEVIATYTALKYKYLAGLIILIRSLVIKSRLRKFNETIFIISGRVNETNPLYLLYVHIY
jgi:hypothetical protein